MKYGENHELARQLCSSVFVSNSSSENALFFSLAELQFQQNWLNVVPDSCAHYRAQGKGGISQFVDYLAIDIW
jgi:hypothetical protein